MAEGVLGDNIPRYDRDFLLSPAKRNQIVELWEVEKFGRDSFGDPNAVSLYGMTPAQWHARGIRILSRTAVSCSARCAGAGGDGGLGRGAVRKTWTPPLNHHHWRADMHPVVEIDRIHVAHADAA